MWKLKFSFILERSTDKRFKKKKRKREQQIYLLNTESISEKEILELMSERTVEPLNQHFHKRGCRFFLEHQLLKAKHDFEGKFWSFHFSVHSTESRNCNFFFFGPVIAIFIIP